MADRYWVGGTGSWNTTNTANWSASSGGPSGASVPTSADNVFFDANSNTGTGAFTVTSSTANCLDFNCANIDGAMTLNAVANLNVFGSWTSSVNFSVSTTAIIIFAATSGSKTITMNGATIDCPISFNGVGGTWQLQDALTIGSTRTAQLVNGALDLNGYTLTAGKFAFSGSTARSLAFGSTGKIVLTGSGECISASPVTNFSFTGTPTIELAYSGAVATSINYAGNTQSQALTFNIIAGTYSFTIPTSAILNLNFTGFSGTLVSSSRTIYGSLTLSSGMTLSAGTNVTTFAATSGTQTITTSGKTIDFPLTFNGVGGTWRLQDALTMGATRAVTLRNGTFDANGFNVTLGTFALGIGTKTLTLGNGTWTVLGSGAFAWNANTNVTGLTVSASTSTISMNSASAKTFAGGGLTWPTLNQGGAGALTIEQSNTFANITNTIQPATITFTASTTQTVSAFGVSGTSGNLITLNSSSAGTRATLSDASGTNSVSYVSIKDIAATGGATWNALLSNGNVDAGNNTGWDFGSTVANKYIYNRRKSKRVIQ